MVDFISWVGIAFLVFASSCEVVCSSKCIVATGLAFGFLFSSVILLLLVVQLFLLHFFVVQLFLLHFFLNGSGGSL